uniref:hypothetical protein n=1 Tax=Succinivibrio sp. TaxID=2053619 RepID=UPI00402A8783
MRVKNPEYAIYIKDSKEPVIKNHITLPKAQWSDLDTKNPFKLNLASTISYKREDKKNDCSVSKQVKNQILAENLVRIDKVDDPLQRRILSSALLVGVDKNDKVR